MTMKIQGVPLGIEHRKLSDSPTQVRQLYETCLDKMLEK